MLFSNLALLALIPAALADWGNLCSSPRKAKVTIGNGQPGVHGELIFYQAAWSDVVSLTGTVSSVNRVLVLPCRPTRPPPRPTCYYSFISR